MTFRRDAVRTAIIVALAAPQASVAADIEEIVVTATRRDQTVMQVPYNISVLNGARLEANGLTDLGDLVYALPGVAGADLGSRGDINNNIVIRGINATDAGNSTIAPNLAAAPVSTYLNETPVFFNVRMLDINRIEVLRGPQGTLYGSGAVGGTMRFIFNEPQLDQASLEVTGGFGGMDESSDSNYEASMIANLPLSDTVALRGFVGFEKLGGVIDNSNVFVYADDGDLELSDPSDINSALITRSETDTDDSEILYGRLSLAWRPTDATELLLSYHRQESEYGGSTQRNLNTPEDSWEDRASVLETLDRTVDVGSLEIEHDFGFASFTSSTSTTRNDVDWLRDSTDFYRTIAAYYFYYPRLQVVDYTRVEQDSLTQELRLVSQGDNQWDWVVGGYYSEQDLDYSVPNPVAGFAAWTEDPAARDAAFGLTAAEYWGFPTYADVIEYYFGGVRPSDNDEVAFTLDQATRFRDTALFGELTFHVSDRWQITGGVRAFWQDFDDSLRQTLPYCGAFCSDDGMNPLGLNELSNSTSIDDQVFKLNTSWEMSDRANLYFVWSEGFRRGGANAVPLSGPFHDPTIAIAYQPDTATNVEAGIKGSTADGGLSYSVAVYNIDWEGVQLDTFTSGGFQAVINAGEARSRGLELEATARLSDSFTAGFGYSYTNAELEESVNVGTLAYEKGDRLPSIPENQATLSLDYLRPDAVGGMDLGLTLFGSYRDSVTTSINPSTENYLELDAYTLWNASAVLDGERWMLRLFIKNIGNEEALSGALIRSANRSIQVPGLSSELGRRGFIGRPRTYGATLTFRFGH